MNTEALLALLQEAIEEADLPRIPDQPEETEENVHAGVPAATLLVLRGMPAPIALTLVYRVYCCGPEKDDEQIDVAMCEHFAQDVLVSVRMSQQAQSLLTGLMRDWAN